MLKRSMNKNMKNKKSQGVLVLGVTALICSIILYLVVIITR